MATSMRHPVEWWQSNLARTLGAFAAISGALLAVLTAKKGLNQLRQILTAASSLTGEGCVHARCALIPAAAQVAAST